MASSEALSENQVAPCGHSSRLGISTLWRRRSPEMRFQIMNQHMIIPLKSIPQLRYKRDCREDTHHRNFGNFPSDEHIAVAHHLLK
jgi:hypothetical protein